MNKKVYNTENLLADALAGLSERSRDIILSRFGIGRDDYETLESIGRRYSITRERVRQIEADALKQVKNQESNFIKAVSVSLEEFLYSRGGVADEDKLTVEFAQNYLKGSKNPRQYKGLVRFILTLDPRFNKKSTNENFSTRWYLKEKDLERQEKVAKQLGLKLKSVESVVDRDKVVSLANSFTSEALNKEAVLSYLNPSKEIEKNVFGQWGLAHWPEIKPRGVKDKAYLVMKQKEKPLHFREVADLINEEDFSDRRALAQTVHNELIKDSRFILVGRGLYALKEWGYTEGTVKDVIKKIIKDNGPVTKDEVVEAVLAERFVKPSTVILNLNSFKKNSEDKYTLV